MSALDDQSRSTDVVNISRIRVAGIGGLGLIAMALVVAWFVPRIGQTLLLGAAAGVVLAVALILRRRAAGPMSSSGRRPGANTTLSIEDPVAVQDADDDRSSHTNVRRAEEERRV